MHTRWQRYPKDGDEAGSFAYKMAAFLGVYPQDGGVTNKMVVCLQDGNSAAFLRVLSTRGQRAYMMAALPKRWRRGSFYLYNVDVIHKMAVYLQNGGVTNKMVTLPTR